MPVHQVGLPADMDGDGDARAGVTTLTIVEDAACAIGASTAGVRSGSLGDPLGMLLVHPRKVITSRRGRNDRGPRSETRGPAPSAPPARDGLCGSRATRRREVVIERYPERGWNARMTDLQAAVGLRQLEALETDPRAAEAVAARYTAALSGVPGIEPPYEPVDVERTWQSYCVRLEPYAAIGRTELMRRLLADGVATRRGVMAIHEEGAYAGEASGPLPHTEAAAQDALMLPLFPDLTDEQQNYVVDRLAAYVVAQAA